MRDQIERSNREKKKEKGTKKKEKPFKKKRCQSEVECFFRHFSGVLTRR